MMPGIHCDLPGNFDMRWASSQAMFAEERLCLEEQHIRMCLCAHSSVIFKTLFSVKQANCFESLFFFLLLTLQKWNS